MLPGKKYTPEDFLKILQHRAWWVLVPFAVVSAVTALYARTLPDLFYSETTILVVPQRVPEAYVRSTVTTSLQDRLQVVQQQILSRTRLEQIVQEFNLYARERASGVLMEDLVVRMRKEIKVVIDQSASSFRIGYVGQNAIVVQDVVNRLAALFINENLRDREVQAENTNQFIEAQLVDAKRQVEDIERRVAAFRQQYSGELPSQLDSNLQQVQNARTQITTVMDSLNRDQDRKIQLERQLSNLKSPPAAGAPAATVTTVQPVAGSTQQRLTLARQNVAAYEARGYLPGYPDLEAAKRVVRELEQTLSAELQGTGQPAGPIVSPAELERRQLIAETEAQLAELNKQMDKKRADQARFEKQAEEFQVRVDAVPARETELTQLMRDYNTYSTNYAALLGKREDSKIAANLERRQVGEQFRLLDPARRAEKPMSPDRRQISMMGMLGGLALGALLVAFLEYRDTTFKTDTEVASILGLPVVAVVPIMESESDHRRAVRKRLLTGVGLGSTVVACLMLVVYTFVR